MRHGKRVAVVIPALNEEEALPKVLGDLPGWIDEAIVVDNGSMDRTAAVARACGATVVHKSERGYGAACLAGIAHCGETDIIVFLDGDYSDYPQDLDRIVDPVAAGYRDLVLGSRTLGTAERQALTPQQRFGNWLACRLMTLAWDTRYTDLGPLRAIGADALRALDMRDRTYGWTIEMQIKAALAGLAVEEVPVRYRARIGTSKISGTVKGTVMAGTKILSMIARMAWRHGLLTRARPGAHPSRKGG